MNRHRLRGPAHVGVLLLAITVNFSAIVGAVTSSGRTTSTASAGTAPSRGASAPALAPILFLAGPPDARRLVVAAIGPGPHPTASQRVLTHPGVRPERAGWLPDGLHALVVAAAAAGRDVWVVDVTGDGWRLLTRAAGAGVGVSADGRAVAVVDGDGGLEVVRVDGTHRRRILAPGPLAPVGVAWRPGSPELAVIGHEPGAQSEDVFLLRTDGTGLRAFLDHRTVASPRCAGGVTLFDDLRWSADGSRLAADAVTVGRGCTDQRVVVVSPAQAAPVVLAAPPGAGDAAYGPRWAPNGRTLAYTTAGRAGAAPQVVLAGADGTGLRVLGAGRDPAWSGDGADLALVTPGGDVAIVTATDDTPVLALSARDGAALDPAFRPPPALPPAPRTTRRVGNRTRSTPRAP